MLAAVGQLHHHAAAARDHIEQLVEHVLLRRRRAACRHFEQEHGGPVAAALEMHEGGLAAVAQPRPRAGLGGEEVDAEILVDRRPFFLAPVEIGIEQEFGFGVGHDTDSVVSRSSAKYLPICEATPAAVISRRQIAWMRGSWSL